MENQKEIWKQYPNSLNYYVSTFGRVYSKSRISSDNRRLKGKFLKQSVDGGGYLKVRIDGETKKVHQMVAETFLNHKTCGYKLVVNHIDFNRTNNKVNNLELVTQRENANLKHIKSSSRFVGVYWNKASKKWHSQIRVKSNKKYLGSFKCEIEASEAYKSELIRIEGVL